MRFLFIFSLLALASPSAALLECYQDVYYAVISILTGKIPWSHEMHTIWGVNGHLVRPQLAQCPKTASCCSFESSIEIGRVYECKEKCPKSLWFKSEVTEKLGEFHVIHYCKKATEACEYSFRR